MVAPFRMHPMLPAGDAVSETLFNWADSAKRPTVPADVRTLIRTMSHAHPCSGAQRIYGELLNSGFWCPTSRFQLSGFRPA